jgi:hypothetical protein
MGSAPRTPDRFLRCGGLAVEIVEAAREVKDKRTFGFIDRSIPASPSFLACGPATVESDERFAGDVIVA